MMIEVNFGNKGTRDVVDRTTVSVKYNGISFVRRLTVLIPVSLPLSQEESHLWLFSAPGAVHLHCCESQYSRVCIYNRQDLYSRSEQL
jgi:hypothetical protein